MKFSARAERAAEKYLNEHNTCRENLSDKQWRVLLEHVRGRGAVKLVIPLFAISILMWGYSTMLGFERTGYLTAYAMPENKIIVCDADTESLRLPIYPQDIEVFLNIFRRASFLAVASLYNTVLLIVLICAYFVLRRQRRRILEAVIENTGSKIEPSE